MERYLRNRETISRKEQSQLAAKRVFVAGCGGLGGYVAEQLARLGVGHLSLLDKDVFEVSNLNRQLYAREDNLGESKATAAMERVHSINSEIAVEGYPLALNEANAAELIRGHDLVMDAFDSFDDRRVLEQACEKEGIPLIHGAIGGLYGQFALILPGERLLEKIYALPLRGLEKTQGNPAFTPAIIASFEVALALQVLLDKGARSNQLYYLDLKTFEIETICFD